MKQGCCPQAKSYSMSSRELSNCSLSHKMTGLHFLLIQHLALNCQSSDGENYPAIPNWQRLLRFSCSLLQGKHFLLGAPGNFCLTKCSASVKEGQTMCFICRPIFPQHVTSVTSDFCYFCQRAKNCFASLSVQVRTPHSICTAPSFPSQELQ